MGVLQGEQSKIFHRWKHVLSFFSLYASWSFCTCSSMCLSHFSSVSSVVEENEMAKTQTNSAKPAKTRYVFCKPKTPNSSWAMGPKTKIPRPVPDDTRPVAIERRLLKCFTATRKVQVRTQAAPRPKSKPYDKNTWLIDLANEVANKLSAHKRLPHMVITRQPKQSDMRPTAGAAK